MIAKSPGASAWPALAQRISDTLGLDFSGPRERDLHHAVTQVAPILGIDGVQACAQFLAHAHWPRDLQHRLAAQLTVGESYFFRDPPLLDLFALQILPELIMQRRAAGDFRLRIWSAGCSRGEEPYTLAFLLRRLLPDLREWDVRILATDIHAGSLEQSRSGVFGSWSFRGVPASVRDAWFDRQADGRWRVSAVLRDMVSFEEHNLAQPQEAAALGLHGAVDVLFCRNVLMYFEARRAREAASRLADALAPGGWLAVSPSEAFGMRFTQLQPVHFEQGIVFRKPIAQAAPGASRALLAPAQDAPRIPSVHPPAAAPAEAPQPHDADEPQACATLALRLADAGRLDEALACCDRWLRADRLDARAHYLRSLILVERGDAAGAREALRRCLYLDAGFTAAASALGRLPQAHE